MHPPFFFVDHRIGPDSHHATDNKRIKRRNRPERLRLTPATSGWPPVVLDDTVVPLRPTGTQAPQLRIVPPPSRSLRGIIGRWLIRAGQRMLLQNRPG